MPSTEGLGKNTNAVKWVKLCFRDQMADGKSLQYDEFHTNPSETLHSNKSKSKSKGTLSRMSSKKLNIFLTGATGYIGGAVLTRLLEHPEASTFNITVLTRSSEKAKLLEKNGVTAVVGSLDDRSIVEKLASEADYAFAIADADSVPAAKAMLSGLKLGYETKKRAPILIHTSGTAVLTDDAGGLYSYQTIWDDANADQIETLPSSQPHRNVDLLVLEADKQGYVKTYFILPSTIYGISTGKLVDQGIAHCHSVQVPSLIRAAIDRGQAGMVGHGQNLWPDVHIDDVADLYIVLFDAIRSGKEVGHGREGFYFGENGEHTLYIVSETIGIALEKRGIGKATPTTFSKEEEQKYFGGNELGGNSRCVGNRSRSIGWKPRRTVKDFIASIEPEVEALLAEAKSK